MLERVHDGEVPVECYEGDGEYGDLATDGADDATRVALPTVPPALVMLDVVPAIHDVMRAYDYQVDAHQHVREGQVFDVERVHLVVFP